MYKHKSDSDDKLQAGKKESFSNNLIEACTQTKNIEHNKIIETSLEENSEEKAINIFECNIDKNTKAVKQDEILSYIYDWF